MRPSLNNGMTKFICNLFIVLLIITGFAVINASAQQQEISDARKYFAESQKAYKEGHTQEALEKLQLAHKLRPNHPTIIYNLAVVNALTGNKKEALQLLSTLSEMGQLYPAGKDPDLATLKDTPEFQKIVAQFEKNQQPVNKSEQAFKLAEKGLITEGIAFDETTEKFFVSSVHKHKIVMVDKNGEAKDFSNAADGLWSVMGMKVDDKRRLLWVCTAALPQMKDLDAADKGKSAVFKYDLKTGKLLKKYLLSGADHVLGDLVISKEGDIYTTDSSSPALYRISAEKDELEKLVDGKPFASPQGLAFSEDGKTLFIADYSLGIYAYDLKTNKFQLLPHPTNVMMLGIDGIYFHKGTIIGTQNGANPHRILRFKLSQNLDKIESCETLEANHASFDEPTLGVIVDSQFYYIANSQWNNVDEKAQLATDKLKEPVILKLKL